MSLPRFNLTSIGSDKLSTVTKCYHNMYCDPNFETTYGAQSSERRLLTLTLARSMPEIISELTLPHLMVASKNEWTQNPSFFKSIDSADLKTAEDSIYWSTISKTLDFCKDHLADVISSMTETQICDFFHVLATMFAKDMIDANSLDGPRVTECMDSREVLFRFSSSENLACFAARAVCEIVMSDTFYKIIYFDVKVFDDVNPIVTRPMIYLPMIAELGSAVSIPPYVLEDGDFFLFDENDDHFLLPFLRKSCEGFMEASAWISFIQGSWSNSTSMRDNLIDRSLNQTILDDTDNAFLHPQPDDDKLRSPYVTIANRMEIYRSSVMEAIKQSSVGNGFVACFDYAQEGVVARDWFVVAPDNTKDDFQVAVIDDATVVGLGEVVVPSIKTGSVMAKHQTSCTSFEIPISGIAKNQMPIFIAWPNTLVN